MPSASDIRPYFLQAVVTAGLVGVATAAVCAALGPKGAGEDYIQDYLSARAILRGENPYQDLNAMRAAAGMPPRPRIPFNPHPPLAILTALPFAALPFQSALLANQAIQVICAAVAWTWFGRLLGCRGLRWAIVGGVQGLWAPVWQGLEWGHPIGFLELTTVALWAALRARRPVATGIAAAAGMSIRPFFAFALVAGRAWPARAIARLLFATVVTSLAFFLVAGTTPLFWLERSLQVKSFIESSSTVPGVLGLELRESLFVFAGGFGAACWLSRRWNRDEAAMALGLAVSFLVYPLAWSWYEVSLLPIATWALREADRTRRSAVARLIFFYLLVGCIPIIVPEKPYQPWAQVAARVALVVGVYLVGHGERVRAGGIPTDSPST